MISKTNSRRTLRMRTLLQVEVSRIRRLCPDLETRDTGTGERKYVQNEGSSSSITAASRASLRPQSRRASGQRSSSTPVRSAMRIVGGDMTGEKTTLKKLTSVLELAGGISLALEEGHSGPFVNPLPYCAVKNRID
ncbi:hypothetical protein LIA77_11781 [Sarocladium implicatum]|nr:hypothetical protein LIA77_11781 [Sarocladium implicatum]